MESLIDYQILQIFIANYDWPANNMRCWRNKKDASGWKFIFFDGDGAFGDVEFDSFRHAIGKNNKAWSADERSTLFLKKLMQNDDFRSKYLNRMVELFSDQFNYENSSHQLEKIKSMIEPEVNNQRLRFGFPSEYETWKDTINYIDYFLKERPDKLEQMTKKYIEKYIQQ